MVKHVILWQLNDELTEAQKQEVKEAAKHIVSAKPLYEALKQAEVLLAAKIESQIDGLGFMAPAEQPLD